jgi:NAD(P)H-hydrate repair Nnr-like enzyme with NAD(P)H-hydrate dehydratase domain
MSGNRKRNFRKTTGAILIGPGLAAPELPDEMKRSRAALARSELPMIVDASCAGLAGGHNLAKTPIRVVTPHPGEAARMLNMTTVEQVQANPRDRRARNFKTLGNCWVVLKGHQTLDRPRAGEIFVNPSGNPHLAQGGSGDVLAGFFAGLLAQPELQKDVGKTIRYAVWQHGHAADKLQARGQTGSSKIW